MSQITIKNVNYSATLGHDDSHTFRATVYKDGKRWCIASDDGWGGPMLFNPIPKSKMAPNELHAEIRAFNNALGPIKTEHGELDASGNLEIIINTLINNWLLEKQVKRDLKNKTIFLETSTDKGLYEYKRVYSPEFGNVIRKEYPQAIILNEIDFAEAVNIYRKVS